VVRRENEVAEKNLLLEKEITERLRSETELAESRQRLKLALQGADLGLWDWDVITGKVIFNERLTEMVGYRVDELEPHVNTWENLIHPDDLEEAKGKLMAHLRGETEFFESEHRARHKNGKWLWIMDRGAVVKRDGDGHPLRAAGTHLDITHRKKAEQDLLAAHDKLESRVEERTRELREAQAELINRALEEGRAQLAAMVLHNIGNAITPVSIYLEQAQSTRMQELCRFQQRCFAELKKNSENLTDYIAQDPRGREIYATLEELIETLPKDLAEQQVLLDKIGVTVNHVGEIISLQQSYAGVGQEIKETVDLNSLIRDALRLQEDSISKRDIVVSTNLSPESPRLLIDKNRLNQVLVNLIKNSCEAIEENETSGARNLSIETCLAGDLVRITITDSGIGVSPDKLDKIFNFGESGKGSSGFGLHYCKMFIEANRGKISLSSLGIGQGASFSINLPLVEGLGRGNDGK
jgi:PAS domain S-box-containing protein